MALRGTLYVAGHTGLVGSACMRRFAGREELRLVTATRAQLDLRDASAVEQFLQRERPDAVVMACGRVGGIWANATYPADFIRDNLQMELALIDGAWKAGVARLIHFGSACMYPKECVQPMRPESLMTGRVEPTSEPYALAKLAGWSLCASYNRQHGTTFTTLIPSTLYGPGDNFDPDRSHVISGLIRKFDEAARRGHAPVTLWGTGRARREFLYVDDLAAACEAVLEQPFVEGPINVGSSESIAIHDLAAVIAEATGYRGAIEWDASRAEGPLLKELDSSAIRAMGWAPRTRLSDGLARTVAWFREHDTASIRKESLCASS